VNAQKETLKLSLTVPMYRKGDQLKILKDDEKLKGSIETIKLKKDNQITIEIPSMGGILFKNE